MVSYTCGRCKKIFNQKCKYDEHINRKIPCIINNGPSNTLDEIYCDVCDKHFSRQDTLKKHLNTKTHKQMCILSTNKKKYVMLKRIKD